MDSGRRASLSFALILIALGAWFLAVELAPAVRAIAYGRATWPLSIVGAGVLMLVAGLITWTPGWAIPACLVGGIGGLLYWQNLTGNWESWAYAWTLIPVFVGVGLILAGVLRGRVRGALIGGGWTIFSGLVMFSLFGSFLGGLAIVGQLWPLLLIAMGVIFLVQALLRPRRS